MKQNYELIIR